MLLLILGKAVIWQQIKSSYNSSILPVFGNVNHIYSPIIFQTMPKEKREKILEIYNFIK